MKKTLLAATLLSTFALTSIAHANTGTISFTGTLTASTCTVDPGAGTGGTTNNIEVDLGTVSFRDLSEGQGTDFGAATRINLDISCTSAGGLNTVKMNFHPSSGTGVDTFDPRLLQTTGGSTGVGIGIINEANQVLALNGGETIDAPLTVSGNNAVAQLSMRAAYILNGNPTRTAGDANGSMPFTLSYE